MSAQTSGKSSPAFRQYRGLLSRLDSLRRYLRAVIWLESLVHLLLVVLIVAPPLFLLDNWLHFTTPLRMLGFAALTLAPALVFVATIRIAFQRWDYERLALRVESHYPQLDNRLINAIQLGAAEHDRRSFALIQAIVDESVREISRLSLREAIDTKHLKKAAIVSAILTAGVAGYTLLMPAQFQNAALRLVFPTSRITPLSRVQLEIAPGDARVGKGEGLLIQATPRGDDLPKLAKLEVRGTGGRNTFAMEFDGARFQHELANVASDFKYRVHGGDFRSIWYEVHVFEEPRIERMTARYESPEYTGLDPEVVDPFDGNVVALQGSRVIISAWTNKKVESAELAMENSAPPVVEIDENSEEQTPEKAAGAVLAASFPIRRSDRYHWSLKDAEGNTNAPAATFTIRASEDAPPRVAITSPRGEVSAPQGEEVNILYTASDDYGLIRDRVREGETGSSRILRERSFDPPRRTLNDGYVVDTSAYEVGNVLRVVVSVADSNPEKQGIARSDPVTIRIIKAPDEKARTTENLEEVARGLLALLKKQQALKKDAGRWRATLRDDDVTAEQRARILEKITFDQSALRTEALALAETAEASSVDWKEPLRSLANAEMREVVGVLGDLAKIPNAPDRQREQVDEAHRLQTRIIDRLRELLDRLKKAAPELAEVLKEDEEYAKDERPRPESVDDLHGAALDFLEHRKGMVSSLHDMENLDMDDFTTSLPQTLENLALQEEEWEEYFKDAREWLKESPMVDSTESGLRDELLEVYSEIDLLPEELRSDPKTIEVSEEETGLELAEELTAELEKWLAEEPDHTKWVMENASEDYDVPLAELPDELEDIVGDLIESEETMTEDIEDMTSNWADSIDKGAGWEAADGPISNYSAKGVTGNILPNDMDISGRSGEGRSGRSLGEMVESVATGKGGRDTPTRMTNDAMGDQRVEDLSTEQVKGVTGGGKIAGTTGYGLVSPDAPQQPQINQELAQRQQDIRMQAISLHERLMKMNLPTANIESSIQSMQRVEQALQDGAYNNLRDLNAVVLGDLKDQRRIVREHFRLRREAPTAEDQIGHGVRQTPDEAFPEEYRNLLSAYYEALSLRESR